MNGYVYIPNSTVVSGITTTTTSTADDRWKFCPSCGTKIGDGWKYCADCGTQVGHIAAPFAIQPTFPGWYWPNQPYGPTWGTPHVTCGSPGMVGNTYTVRGDEQMTYTSC